MTLRDELEAKLRSIYVNADSDVFGVIADEVLRQIEWNRRPEREMQVMEVWDRGGKRRPNIVQNLPPSMAPDDWVVP